MRSTLSLRDGLFQRVAIAPFDNLGNWILLEEFTYHIGFKGSNETITIPAGFIFNGMSIPRIFWLYAHPMTSDTIISSLLHDYLFDTKMYSLDKTDYIFYDVLIACQVNPYKAITLYVGLGFGSWYFWKKDLRESTQSI